jgi:hypothetical protein
MEWLIVIYLGIGVVKALTTYGNSNPAKKPAWMSTERNPLKILLLLLIYAVLWPFG